MAYAPFNNSSQHAGHHHTHSQPSNSHSHNLGLLAVLIHLCGDAVNSQFFHFGLMSETDPFNRHWRDNRCITDMEA